MKLNKWTLGLAALLLAGMTFTATAQERVRTTGPLINTAIGTAYYAAGGTNYVYGPGLIAYSGGTTNVTLTSGQTLTSASTGVPVNVSQMWNGPFYWEVAASAAGSGTSNTTLYADVSPDGAYWVSQALSVTVAQAGTSTNMALAYFGYQNGTNILSGYQWLRWSGATTAQGNAVTVQANQLNQLR